ncbi:ribonuclease T [Novosphingobium sp. 9U]|uniref:ribonuclease T2 family protein n=1 Tax=Novosphingobium sp. 9U TaxID=2653158 RepID=UPI0012F18A22|nr:ribonuclease T [Novosphingobium sp. 9U]VWX53668.1 Ribonuclease T [Novosphingobium sp. 9U]
MRRLALLLALLPAPALAQAYQCTPPTRIDPVGSVAPDGPPRRTAVAGYTLAASWSPDYCKTSGDTGSMQCSGRNGRFGFVLHGLWPEARRGLSPQWCRTGPAPSPQELRGNLCMTPSARLLAHEWAKHGTCMAKTPAQYFRVAAILWRSIRWPDADRLSRQDALTAGDLRAAFVRLNPAWKPEQVGVQLSRTGWLREVQLCYSRRFLPAKCDRRHTGASDAAPLKIWRGL